LYIEDRVMVAVKAVAAVTLVAAIACSIFVFGWIGLALLGY
jgi:hypothetical protein